MIEKELGQTEVAGKLEKMTIEELSNDTKKVQGSWDIGLNFDRMERFLLEQMEVHRKERYFLGVRRLAYTATLYIQLRNGARLSEGVDTFDHWLTTGNREPLIRVRKIPINVKKVKGTRKATLESGEVIELPVYEKIPKSEARLEEEKIQMLVPNEVTEADRQTFLKFKKQLLNGGEALRSYTKNVLKIRTHALRYAWRSKMAELGVDPMDMAKMQGRAGMGSLYKYTQKVRAQSLKRKYILGE